MLYPTIQVMGSIPPAVSMEFITIIRGARSLLHQGYRYTLNCRTADGQIYWRCQDRSCSGRVVTDTNDQLVTCNDKHTHPPKAPKVSCSWLQVDCQPGGGGNTDFMRKDWQQSKRSTRQVTTPSVNFSKLTAIGCHFDCLYL